MKSPIEFKYRFELLVPLTDSEGRPFSQTKVAAVSDKLLARFRGCRSLPSPFVGLWQHQAITYREQLMSFIVDAPRSDESLDWFLSYKQQLKRQFKRLEIYLAVTEVLWL